MQIPPEFDPNFDARFPGCGNLFYFPHKFFRKLWMTVIGDVGKTDFQDQEEVQMLIPFVTMAADAYIEHNHGENEFFLSMLEEKDPEQHAKWKNDHKHHEEELEVMKKEVRRIAAIADNTERRIEGLKWSSVLHRFLAADLEHMDFEENQIMSLLAKHFPAPALKEQEMKLIKSLRPEFLKQMLPFCIISTDTVSLVQMCRIIHMQTARAPPQAWAGFCAQVKGLVNARAFNKALQRFPDLDGTRRS